MINLAIVTHGEFGAYMVEAAESIVGRQTKGVSVVSVSPRQSLEQVRARIREVIEELRGDEGVVVITDIPGGTPSNVALPAAKDFKDVWVLSGVNLYMLISAFSHRHEMAAAELCAKIAADAQKSIKDMKALLMAKVK